MSGKMANPAAICIVLMLVQFVKANQIENFKIVPVNLNYDCARRSDGTQSEVPIILMHGMGTTKSNWDGVYETLVLQSGRKVCRVDLRNHGDSPHSKETSVAAMATDIIHFMDEIGAEKAVLVGHSLGGKVAIHTAVTYAGRVESIVAEDISPELSPVIEDSVMLFWKVFKLAMDKVPEGSDETQAKKLIVDYMKHLMKQFNAKLVNEEKYGLPPFTCNGGTCQWLMNVDDILNDIEKDLHKWWTPSVGLFEGPALFLYGTESPIEVLSHEEDIKELFPNAQMIPFEGAGHSIHGYFPGFENEILKLVKHV